MAAQTDSLRKFAILATKAKMHAKAEELWQRLVDANNEDGAACYPVPRNAQSALGRVRCRVNALRRGHRGDGRRRPGQGLPRERLLCLY